MARPYYVEQTTAINLSFHFTCCLDHMVISSPWSTEYKLPKYRAVFLTKSAIALKGNP